MSAGESFAFVIDAENVRVIHAPAPGFEPFACFEEWASDADARGYRDL